MSVQNQTEIMFLSNNEKIKILEILELFINCSIPFELIDNYLYTEDYKLQDYIKDNLKYKFEWCTAISIIESAFNVLEDAKSNGNI